MAMSRADFWSFIIDFVTRNPNLGIPALEDRLFANSLIFDYFYNEGATVFLVSFMCFVGVPGF